MPQNVEWLIDDCRIHHNIHIARRTGGICSFYSGYFAAGSGDEVGDLALKMLSENVVTTVRLTPRSKSAEKNASCC